MEYISTGYPDLPSRSFYDDNTDSEDESPDRPDGAARLPPVFRWNTNAKPANGQKKAASILLVAVDPIASAVAKENVLAKGDMHPIGTILLKGAPLAECSAAQRQPTDPTCFVYGSGDVILVACQHEVPQEQAVDWAQAVFDNAEPQSVYVLVTEPAFKFIDPERSADQSEMPLLRAIRTSARLEEKGAGVGAIPPLAPPNIIASGAAAVANHCEVQGIPCTAVVAYRHNWAGIGDIETLIGCEAVFDEPGLAGVRCAGRQVLSSKRSDYRQVAAVLAQRCGRCRGAVRELPNVGGRTA